MNITATYSENGVTVEFKKSLRNAMFYRQLREVLVNGDDVPDQLERTQFAWLAAFVVDVDGLEWKAPTTGASKKQIESSYQAFLDAVPDFDMFNALLETVNRLHAPAADEVQRPDDTLTDEEHADPN